MGDDEGVVLPMLRAGRSPLYNQYHRYQSFSAPGHPMGIFFGTVSTAYYSTAWQKGVLCVTALDGGRNLQDDRRNKGALYDLTEEQWEAFCGAAVRSIMNAMPMYLSVYGGETFLMFMDLDYKSEAPLSRETLMLHAATIAKIMKTAFDISTCDEELYMSVSWAVCGVKVPKNPTSGLYCQGMHLVWYNLGVNSTQAYSLLKYVSETISNVTDYEHLTRRAPSNPWSDVIDPQPVTKELPALRMNFCGKARKCPKCDGKKESTVWCRSCKGKGKAFNDATYRLQAVYNPNGTLCQTEQNRTIEPAIKMTRGAGMTDAEVKQMAIKAELGMTLIRPMGRDTDAEKTENIAIDLTAVPSKKRAGVGGKQGFGKRRFSTRKDWPRKIYKPCVVYDDEHCKIIPSGTEETHIIQGLLRRTAAVYARVVVTEIRIMFKRTTKTSSQDVSGVRVDIQQTDPLTGEPVPCINVMHPMTGNPVAHNGAATVFFYIANDYKIRVWCECACDTDSNRAHGKCSDGPFEITSHVVLPTELIWQLFQPPMKEMQAMMMGEMVTTQDPTLDIMHHEDDRVYLKQSLFQATGLMRMLQQTYIRAGGHLDFGSIRDASTTPTSAYMSLMLRLQETSGGSASMDTVRKRFDTAITEVKEAEEELHITQKLARRTGGALAHISSSDRAQMEAQMEKRLAAAKTALAKAAEPSTVTLQENPAHFIDVSADGVVSGEGLAYLFNAMAS